MIIQNREALYHNINGHSHTYLDQSSDFNNPSTIERYVKTIFNEQSNLFLYCIACCCKRFFHFVSRISLKHDHRLVLFYCFIDTLLY